MIGKQIGPYEITAKLGEGGMGEVYRATDSNLRREVAIKVLPAAFTADTERLSRFEREAQLLAQLNHPSIAQIYGLEASGETRALVMELVPGPTLAERLEAGPLSVEESLGLALQIAQALEEAHEKGIVHRDLKPQNIKVTLDGKVKVLDFGLAKAMEPAGGAPSSADLGRSPTLMNSPTLTAAGTQLGVILGTAAYMAPEQARGGAVDKRADIWAFGVVFFEMLTGRSAFSAETVPDTLAAVLTRELDRSALPASTPAALRDLLRRCLERKPKNRLHDIADARLVLDDLLSGRIAAETPPAASAGSEPGRGAWIRKLPWLAAGLLLGALAIAALDRTLLREAPLRPPVVRSLTYSGTSGDASISADRRFVAFVSGRGGAPRIWLKQLATGEEVALTAGRDLAPVISPDSNSVLFTRVTESGFDLYRIPLVGGEPRRLVRDVLLSTADWTPDGRQVVFARELDQKSRLLLIPAEGGAEKLLLEQEAVVRGTAVSPDGRRLLMESGGRVNTISSIAFSTVELDTGARRELFRLPSGSQNSAPRWDGNDAVLFAWSSSQAGRGEVLLQRLKIGEPTPQALFSFPSRPRRIDLAGPGALVFDAGGTHQNLLEVAAGSGGTLGRELTGGPTLDRQPAYSPDGRRIVFTSDRSGSLDLWSLEVEGGAVRRLTFDAADDWDPHWSPDGRHLLWSSNRSGHFEIWIAEPDGTGARQLTADGVDAENPGMSADGGWVVYSSSNPAGRGIWKIRSDGQGAQLLLAGNYTLPELSTKSDWVSAVETTPGRERPVRIVRLEDGAPVAELVVSGGVRNPGRSRWLPDGHTLVVYGSGEGNRGVLYEQPIVPGRDTRGERRVVAVGDERRYLESFAVSPVDGRIVVSAGWSDSDVLIAEGIPGIGASLPRREK